MWWASQLCWRRAPALKPLRVLRVRDVACAASDDEADEAADNAAAVGSDDEAESGSEAEDAIDAMSEEEDD